MNAQTIYSLDDRVPLQQAVPFGLQHVLAMFVANITPIIILANVAGIEPSLSVGLGFNQASSLFSIFPQMVRTIFADNCVAVVFLLALLLELTLPKKVD